MCLSSPSYLANANFSTSVEWDNFFYLWRVHPVNTTWHLASLNFVTLRKGHENVHKGCRHCIPHCSSMLHQTRKPNRISHKTTNEMGHGSIEVGCANNADSLSPGSSSRLCAQFSDPISLSPSPLRDSSIDNEAEIENQQGMPLDWQLDPGAYCKSSKDEWRTDLTYFCRFGSGR